MKPAIVASCNITDIPKALWAKNKEIDTSDVDAAIIAFAVRVDLFSTQDQTFTETFDGLVESILILCAHPASPDYARYLDSLVQTVYLRRFRHQIMKTQGTIYEVSDWCSENLQKGWAIDGGPNQSILLGMSDASDASLVRLFW